MSKNKNVSHEHIATKNSNGDNVKIFHSNHYNEHSYVVTEINGSEVNTGGAWETLSNAVKATEKQTKVGVLPFYIDSSKTQVKGCHNKIWQPFTIYPK